MIRCVIKTGRWGQTVWLRNSPYQAEISEREKEDTDFTEGITKDDTEFQLLID
jgi:hypothetical protein